MGARVRREAMVVCGLLVALASSGVPRAADGRSTDEPALERALERALHCQVTRLRGRALDCATTLEGAERIFVEDVVALAYGELADPARIVAVAGLPAQLSCQRAIARSMGRLAWQALSGRGRPHTPGSDLAAACREAVADLGDGLTLPAVGPQCAAAVGAPGDRLTVDALLDCFAALLSVWADRIEADPEPLRPNIVLILTDDQRWDTVDDTHPTDGLPAMPSVMREIAASGVSFRNSFVTNPVCGPSRASLLTGQYTHHHRVLRNAGAQGGAIQLDDASTLATWLQAAGYRTGFYGKYLNGYHTLRATRGNTYVPPGWDDWRGLGSDIGNTYFDYELVENGELVHYGSSEQDYSTDVLSRHAARFIDASANSRQPFFLLWSPTAPHSPFLPAPRHQQLFLGADDLAPLDAPSFFESDVSDKPAWVRALDPFSILGAIGTHIQRVLQLQMLQSVDDFVADLLPRLRALGIADDTLVIFSSDNGNAWGEHRWTSKACVYEECLRVPLEIRYPRLAPLPREEETLARGIDLAPTLAELAGAPIPPGRDGRSLVRVLDGTERVPAEPLHFECYSGARFTYLGTRDDRFKFVEHLSGEQELYDLQVDPFELENLASRPEHAARVAALRERAVAPRPNWPDDLH